jgi:predicted metal-dependent hydrolase
MNLILTSYKEEIKDCFSTLKIKPTPILHKWLIAKWGYCQTRSRKIYISDLLCAFPENIIKYVIVHEIAHLLHPNHSDKFWSIVSIFYPDYKLIRKYMKNKDLSI